MPRSYSQSCVACWEKQVPLHHTSKSAVAVGVSAFDVQDIQRRNWWRGKWKLDHLAFDKNWELPFVAGPTSEPNGNQENAVATARRFVFDGVDLVLTRDEPVAPNAQVGHHLGTGSNLIS